MVGFGRVKWLAALALAAGAWWFYAGPATLAKGLRNAAGEAASPLIAERVNFAAVNAGLSGDLAEAGGLDARSFAHLLLHGWLAQQRAVDTSPLTTGVSAEARRTRLYLVRYKALNRATATFWDASQFHQVILTLTRPNPLYRWQVTGVRQYNACAFDFDCAHVPNPYQPNG